MLNIGESMNVINSPMMQIMKIKNWQWKYKQLLQSITQGDVLIYIWREEIKFTQKEVLQLYGGSEIDQLGIHMLLLWWCQYHYLHFPEISLR